MARRRGFVFGAAGIDSTIMKRVSVLPPANAAGKIPVAVRHPLIEILQASGRPMYVIDADRRIVYCNPALETWLELPGDRIVGRLVEYHSESGNGELSAHDTADPLTGLCPPPRAMAGEACSGTVSCALLDGRVVQRRADFIPLNVVDSPADAPSPEWGDVFALLAAADLSPHEWTAELSPDSSADELHRTIRRFRRAQAERFAAESLLGDSSGMRKVRSQVAAAASSGANVLVCGRRGTGRAHVARAIHYQLLGDASVKLLALSGQTLTDDSLRRAIDSLSSHSSDSNRRHTLLIEHIEHISATHQTQLIDALRRKSFHARVIATTCEPDSQVDAADEEPPVLLAPPLRDEIATITIQMPRLSDRLEDLPLLAQFFLEAANQGSHKQVGSLRADALDLLSLYEWPGELDELRDVIKAAHRASASHTITPADLPAVVHHAAKAAALPIRHLERINLPELLASIEKEAIERALRRANGNKSEAAELLGLTRPRLYRMLEQMGLTASQPAKSRPVEDRSQLPDFRVLDPQEADE
jgi:DNA-binding NtrC family response regulator